VKNDDLSLFDCFHAKIKSAVGARNQGNESLGTQFSFLPWKMSSRVCLRRQMPNNNWCLSH